MKRLIVAHTCCINQSITQFCFVTFTIFFQKFLNDSKISNCLFQCYKLLYQRTKVFQTPSHFFSFFRLHLHCFRPPYLGVECSMLVHGCSEKPKRHPYRKTRDKQFHSRMALGFRYFFSLNSSSLQPKA